MVDIETRGTGTDHPDHKTRRRWLPFTIFAAVVAIVVIVAVAVLDGTEESTPVETVDSSENFDEPVPTETIPTGPEFGAESASAAIEEYFAAFEAGDVDTVIALFTPGTDPATTLCFKSCETLEASESLEWLEKLLTFKSAAGTVFIDPSCEPTSTSAAEVSVRCDYVEHPGVARIIGGPTVPVVATFVISPDGIDAVNRNPGASYVVDVPFDSWMIRNHLDDRAGIVCCYWESVEDARQGGLRAAQYAPEWAAFLEEHDCDYLNLLCGRTR